MKQIIHNGEKGYFIPEKEIVSKYKFSFDVCSKVDELMATLLKHHNTRIILFKK